MGLLVATVILVVIIIWGWIHHQKKINSDKPMYELSYFDLIIAESMQVCGTTVKTKDVFSQGGNKQDQLFLNHYQIGQVLTINQQPFTISRIKKYVWSENITRTHFTYQLYFQEYENCEFPLDIVFEKSKQFKKMSFTSTGVELVSANDESIHFNYNDITFKAREHRITIETKNRSVAIERSHLVPADERIAEEILQKYSAKININQFDTV